MLRLLAQRRNWRTLSLRQHVDGKVIISCCCFHNDCICECIFDIFYCGLL